MHRSRCGIRRRQFLEAALRDHSLTQPLHAVARVLESAGSPRARATTSSATELARHMVCEWGMSDAMGPLAFGKQEEQIFLGYEVARHQESSEETAVRIDEEGRDSLPIATRGRTRCSSDTSRSWSTWPTRFWCARRSTLSRSGGSPRDCRVRYSPRRPVRRPHHRQSRRRRRKRSGPPLCRRCRRGRHLRSSWRPAGPPLAGERKPWGPSRTAGRAHFVSAHCPLTYTATSRSSFVSVAR